MFINYASILLVAGGTLAAAMISFKGVEIIKAIAQIFNVLIPHNVNNQTLYAEVRTIIEWGRIVRKDGLLELSRQLENRRIRDDMLKFGVQLLTTGYRGEELREMLTNFCDMMYERKMNQAYILRAMAATAPAFGMIGTLVGLIIMLDNLGSSSGEIGRGMAVALLTTLYGVLMAQLIFKPSAEKLQQKEELMKFRNMLISEGFILLSESQDSITIQDHLNSFLDPSMHFNVVKKL